MNKFYLVAFCLILLASCKNDNNTDNTDTAATSVPSTTTAPATPSTGGSALTPLNPGDSPLVSILTSNYWVFEFYIDPDDKANNILNKGRWYQLNPDGTFTNGKWQEQLGSGSWILAKNDLNKDILRLDNVVDSEDAEFEIQFNKEADASSWIGTKTFGQSGVMIKAINLLTAPTKAQFGVAE
ncbi:MAG: hypothetical protein AAF798_22340 [Bacteroidota bacterium]